MDYLLNSNDNPPIASQQERRKHPREDCSINANYMVQGRWHRGFIQNISEGGAYVLTFEDKVSSPGEGMTVTPSQPDRHKNCFVYLREQ